MRLFLQPTYAGKLPVAPDPADFAEFPPLHDALERYHRARELENETRLEVQTAARSIESAEARDAEALANALEAGQKDPGPKYIIAARKQAEDAQRRMRAAQIAADRAMHAVNAAWREDGQEVVAALKARLSAQREELSRALDKVATVHGEMSRTVRVLNTDREFDLNTGKVRDRSYPASVELIAITPGSERTPGAPPTILNVEHVFAELRALGGPLNDEVGQAAQHRPPLVSPAPEEERPTPRAVRRMPQPDTSIVDGALVVVPNGKTEADD